MFDFKHYVNTQLWLTFSPYALSRILNIEDGNNNYDWHLFWDTGFKLEALRAILEGGLVDFEKGKFLSSSFEQDYKNRMSNDERLIFDTLNFTQQFSYLANAQYATWKSEELFPNSLYNGKGDAFRHAYWNAANVIDLGYQLTEDLTTAHENVPPSYPYHYKEKNMDLFNNEVGRSRWNFFQDGFATLEASIYYAILNGLLKYLNNLGPDGRATILSILIPTNQ